MAGGTPSLVGSRCAETRTHIDVGGVTYCSRQRQSVNIAQTQFFDIEVFADCWQVIGEQFFEAITEQNIIIKA